MKIVVIGGTGLIGSKVVQKLARQGHEAIAAAPNTGVDTFSGRGLAKALAGAQVVIDVSNSPSPDDRVAMDFFQTSGRNLAAAEQNAGIRHHVALSVVGTDRLQVSGYFRAKQTQEHMIEASAIPYTLIHATQFFEFIRTIADISTTNGVVQLPPVKFQPIAADEVASAIAEIAVGEPANGMIEIAGPETFSLDHAVRSVLKFDQDARKVVTNPGAPYYGVQVSDETLIPRQGARITQTTLAWWLTHVSAPPIVICMAPLPEPAH